MAVLLKIIDMPIQCSACPFSERLDNMRTFCKWYPMEAPQNDGDKIPQYCPCVEVKDGQEKV